MKTPTLKQMKNRNKSLKKLAPVPAAAAVLALAATAVHAQTPLFSANFPASWNGTGTTVTNLSSGAGVGFQSGTATYTSGYMALSGVGGIKVTPAESLANATVAADGGFTYDISFLWDGTNSSSFGGDEKLIDYAGTESLQLTTSAGSASLQMLFANDAGAETTNLFSTILPNTWYNVEMTFNTAGNSLVGGDISGIADLYVDGVLVDSAAATKGTYGDGLDRPIGIGEFGYGHTTSIIGLYGDISAATVDLGVPEPSSLALSALGGCSLFGMLWRVRRRKA
jgi:hypothetical protein